MHHLQRAICATMAPRWDFGSCLSSLLVPQPQLDVHPTAGTANSCAGWPASTSKPPARLTAASWLHSCPPQGHTYSREQPSQGKSGLSSLVGKQGDDEAWGDPHKANADEGRGPLVLTLTFPWGRI